MNRNAGIKSNHPIHITDENGNLSQSAFIPFCGFGGDFTIMGDKIDQFDIPVCNSFRSKILQNQLCYEVDLDKFKKFSNIENQLKKGFLFIYDVNEDKERFRKKNMHKQLLEFCINFFSKQLLIETSFQFVSSRQTYQNNILKHFSSF